MTRRPRTTGRQGTSTTPEPNHARALWITAAGLDARTLLDMVRGRPLNAWCEVAEASELLTL